MLDTKSLVRRQELLSRARRARHEWLEGCRAKRLLESPVKTTSERWGLRRECEVEVIEESATKIFASAGRVTRFLSDVVDDEPGSYPLVPLAGDDDWCRAVDDRVERKCRALLDQTERGKGEDDDALERKEEAEIDTVIETLKHPDYADIVRSTQHFVDSLRGDDDDDDDDDEDDDDEKDAVNKKKTGLLALEAVRKKETSSDDEEPEDDEREPVVASLNFTSAPANDASTTAAMERVKSFAKRIVATVNSEDVTQAAVETILFRRLASRFFGPLSDDPKVAKRARLEDEFLERRLKALDFLDFKHLGAAAPSDTRAFQDGARFLASLHTSRSPSDATRRLKLASRRFVKAHNTDKRAQDAATDDLLPYFVVGLVQTKPPLLASVANFLNTFVVNNSGPGRGQDAFVVTNLLGAVDFLANLQPSSLDGVDKPNLQKQLEAAGSSNNQKDRLLTDNDNEDNNTLLHKDNFLPASARRPGRREVSAREIRALRLAQRAESAMRASALAQTFDTAPSWDSKILNDYKTLLAQVDAFSGSN